MWRHRSYSAARNEVDCIDPAVSQPILSEVMSMDLYKSTGRSIPQRILLLAVQTVVMVVAGWLLLGGDKTLNGWFGWRLGQHDGHRQVVLFALFLISYARITFMVLVLLRRPISWQEALAVPAGFALYYVGFPLFSLVSHTSITRLDSAYVVLFLLGSWVSTYSEWLRDRWKRDPQRTSSLKYASEGGSVRHRG